jgi:hypothetical protein
MGFFFTNLILFYYVELYSTYTYIIYHTVPGTRREPSLPRYTLIFFGRVFSVISSPYASMTVLAGAVGEGTLVLEYVRPRAPGVPSETLPLERR